MHITIFVALVTFSTPRVRSYSLATQMSDISSQDSHPQQPPAKRPKVTAVVPQPGAIEYMELLNFMCHEYLEVRLGPQVNFVVGHNGSGKSAILTALTVSLGGKATFTNRGASLKQLIKEGQAKGQVTVRISNNGDGAYRPEVYGNKITVVRAFSREGPASYKVKSAAGKTIATTFEEVSRICDALQIVVDNPMAILTQDTARMFLANSTPLQKYTFFLKGTQLEKLFEDYGKLGDHLEQMNNTLARKRRIKPDLERAVKILKDKWALLEEARHHESRINELQSELIWSKVQSREQELDRDSKIVDAKRAKVDTCETRFSAAIVYNNFI